MEIIRLVEESNLSVRKTLEELGVNRSSFYKWYRAYLKHGYDGLALKKRGPRRFWNKIPDIEKVMIIDKANLMPVLSPRELAWFITDTEGYYISESSVYRILKAAGLITSPAFNIITASDKFKHPTSRADELWQLDFTYFKIIQWGWNFLASVLDDYSRYIVYWKLYTSMTTDDVKDVLELALEATHADKPKLRIQPRLLSDNGPCFISSELKKFLHQHEISHTRGAPYHPQTQGKIERYHRTLKNVILLDKYFFPGELEREIGKFIDYYNNERYHEGINNMRPVDVYFGKDKEIALLRRQTKKETLGYRKMQNLNYLYCS
jgi:transposase InsO family protein